MLTLSYTNEKVAVQIISLKWYILTLIFTIKVVIRICLKVSLICREKCYNKIDLTKMRIYTALLNRGVRWKWKDQDI